MLIITGISCKKQQLVEPDIQVKSVYVEKISATSAQITFELSNLGYQKAGLSYYKKSDPASRADITAHRIDGKFKVLLQNLSESTDYQFNVNFVHLDQQKSDTHQYYLKTLSNSATAYNLSIAQTNVNYDEQGLFSLNIEGENLNELNLSKLELKVNGSQLEFGYPRLVSSNKYQLTATGKVNPFDASNAIIASYQGKEILFQLLDFTFASERYYMNYALTNLRPTSFPSLFGSELYYFQDNQVIRYNAEQQRMVTESTIPISTIQTGAMAKEFQGELYFTPVQKSVNVNPNDHSDFSNHPQAYSYSPSSRKWTGYPFPSQTYPLNTRMVRNAQYFTHKGELYLSYDLTDVQGAIPLAKINTENYLFRLNRSTRNFQQLTNFSKQIVAYHFVSIQDQLYLCGMVPVKDQGLDLSATYAVFKVDDQFNTTEIYRGGSISRPLTISPRQVISFDNKILIGISASDLLIFDPSSRQMEPVYIKKPFNHSYFTGFVSYNNKIHLFADIGAASNKIYEISIYKGR